MDKHHKIISIGLSPNLNRSSVMETFKVICQPWLWDNKEERDSLKEKFANLYMISSEMVFPMISGRAAIYHFLRASAIKKGDEVIIQGFNCVAVVNAIRWVGAKPIIVDIEPDTLNVSVNRIQEQLTSQTRAIIIQHTFGLPFSQWAELEKIIKDKNIIIIEDCAHALGAEINGIKAGKYGDAAIFSFGRDKMISSVFGGMLLINNKKWLNSVQEEVQQLQAPAKGWILKNLMHPLITGISLLPFPFYLLGQILHRIGHKIGLLENATSREEKELSKKPEWINWRYPGGLARVSCVQLAMIDENNRCRGEVANRYQAAGIPCAQKWSGDSTTRVWLRYPVLVNDPECFMRMFAQEQIYLGDWYNQVIGPKGVDLERLGYQKGQTPVAELTARQIINLPVYPRLKSCEVERIIKLYHAIKE